MITQRDFIESEITELEGLLADIPKQDAIDRLSLENRLKEAQKDLSKLNLQEARYPIPGVGAVVMHPTRPYHIIMGMRKGAHGAGTWMIPGGKIEKWSDGQATAIQEVKEETNLDVRVVHLRRDPRDQALNGAIGISTSDYFQSHDLHFITLYYAATIVGDNIEPLVMEPEKCEQWIWHDIRKPLPEPFFLPLESLMTSLLAQVEEQGCWIPEI